MFRSRTRKVLRDIWSRKGRTALASISIFIGVLGVVVLMSVSDLLVRQLTEDLKQDELAMQQVFLSTPGDVELDNAAYIETLKALPGVENVEGRVNTPLYWKQLGEEDFEDGLLVAAWEPFEASSIQPMRLVEGSYPVAGQDQIVVEQRTAGDYGLEIGDELVLRVLSGDTPQEETWTIVGLVFQPYRIVPQGPEAAAPDTLMFATYEDAQHIAGFTGLGAFYVRYTDFDAAEEQANAFLATVAQQTPYVTMFSRLEDPAQNRTIEESQQVTGVLNVLALMAMVVSGFLVTNIINAIVAEQRRLIGVMKSMGATQMDNLLMYVGVALGYGILGTIPAVLVGMPLASLVASGIADMLNSLIQGFRISTVGVTMGVVMGLIVPVLAAVVPVLIGTRVTILQAMTDLGISVDYGKGILARIIGALPVPVNVRQALSNVTRKKGRLILTWLTLTLAVGAFMAVFGLFYNVNELLSGIFDTFAYEIELTPNQSQDFDALQTLILEEVDEIAAVYPSVGMEFQFEGYTNPMSQQSSVQAVGFDTTSDVIGFDLEAGTAWQDDPDREGVVITSGIAEQLDKAVGDKLVYVAGGNTFESEIIGVTSLSMDMVFMDWRALAQMAGFTAGAPAPGEYVVQGQIDEYGRAPIVGLEISDELERLIVAGINLTGNGSEAIITTDLAEQGDYQIGDALALTVGDSSATYPIVGILQMAPGMVPEGEPSDMVVISWKELAALQGRDLAGEPVPNSAIIQVDAADPTVGDVDQSIDQIAQALLAEGITAEYTNQLGFAESISQMIQTMGTIFTMSALVMAAVGAIGLLAALSMSVFERQKEIGVMRSIGASSGTIAGQFLVEGNLIGILAWVVGVPLAFLVSQGLAAIFPFEMDNVGVPLISLAIGLAGMIVVATVSSLWPSISAARKTVSEIIRYQ